MAIRTVGVDGSGIRERVRDLAFGLLEELVGAAEWEYQATWPTGALHGNEVVKWALRAPTDD